MPDWELINAAKEMVRVVQEETIRKHAPGESRGEMCLALKRAAERLKTAVLAAQIVKPGDIAHPRRYD